MALFDRSLRPDGRRSSSFCSTATLVVFVALCLLGLWSMTSPDTIPAAMSSSEKKAEVKEEDVSIDATNTVKQDTSSGSAIQNAAAAAAAEAAETAAESTDAENPGKPAGDGEDNAEGEAQPKNQSFDDENGKTEGGELVKRDAGEADGGQAAKNVEETAIDVKDNTGQDKNAEETATDVKDSVSGGGGGTANKQTFDDENGKLEGGVGGVELVKEGGGKAGEKINPEEITSSSDQIDGKKDNEAEKPEQKPAAAEAFPSGQAELLSEAAAAQNGSFPTQAAESRKEKKVRAEKKAKDAGEAGDGLKLCNSSAGADYIPCLDNERAIRRLRSTKHYEHRERHCPAEAPTCLVPAPEGYKQPIRWPHSRNKIWYHNVPHTKLAAYKGHQNWVKVSGEYLTFPGGGTQFKHGALHYIDVIQEALPDIAWGKRSRVVLDVGCGVASFGGYLFERDVLTMSFAPKDEHEAQVQFALERGIPAMSAVMGTKRLPFPSNVFDVVHCARCRVPWHIEGGKLLLELNRLLRPGGFFVWSATPVYQKLPEDVEIWNEMEKLTKSMCWEMVKKMKDTIDQVGLVVFRKPSSNDCYQTRRHKEPPVCETSDDPNAAWNIKLRACMHEVPLDPGVRGARWPEQWPERLEKAPYWLNSTQVGVYGKPAPDDFVADYEHWKKAVKNSYLTGMGIDWKTVRNVMDMRAVYGGFAAALRDMNIWVMNIVTIDSPDTLPIIYERGLFGIYHDWCESFSTYPRSYDLVHADHLFSKLKTRCKMLPVIIEVDRILRPNGKLIVRDDKETISEIENIVKSLHWEVRLTFSKQKEGLLCTRKTMWQPTEVETR